MKKLIFLFLTQLAFSQIVQKSLVKIYHCIKQKHL